MEAAAPVLAPIVEAVLPDPPPTPGNPHLTQPQDEWISTKPRGNYPELPEGWGRTDPASPVVTPIEVPATADPIPAEVVAELQADLADRPEAVTWRAAAEGFRGLEDLL